MRPSLTIVLLALSLVASSWTLASDPPLKLSLEERRKIDAAVAAYRKAKTQDEKLKQIDAAGELGLNGLRVIDSIVSAELSAALQRYRGQVNRVAAMAYAKRLNQKSLPEIDLLRKRVMDPARSAQELTKEQIVSMSDPALARLKALILIDRAEVVDNNPLLLKLRQGLTPAGEKWQRVRELQVKLESEMPKPEGAAAAEAEVETVAPTFQAYLKGDEEQVVALALPMSEETRSVFTGNAAMESKVDPEEFRCITQLNLTRALLGLNPLVIDLKLIAAGRDHSSDMITHKFFAHESPVPKKTTPWDRAANFGTSASGENIAYGNSDGVKTSDQWWHSPGHHKNMLGEHKRVGVGRFDRHWTQLFGR